MCSLLPSAGHFPLEAVEKSPTDALGQRSCLHFFAVPGHTEFGWPLLGTRLT